MRATFSLGKSVFGFSRDVFALKTRFRSVNAFSPLRGSEMRKSFLLSENFVIKCENPFMERKHRLQKRKRDYPEKTSLEKTYALIEGKRRSRSRKGTPPFRFRYLDAYSLVNMRFRSGKVLSPYLLRRFLSEKSVRLSGARFRLVNAFSPLRGTY